MLYYLVNNIHCIYLYICVIFLRQNRYVLYYNILTVADYSVTASTCVSVTKIKNANVNRL